MKKRLLATTLVLSLIMGVHCYAEGGTQEVSADEPMMAIPVNPMANPPTNIYAMNYKVLSSYTVNNGSFNNYKIQDKVPIYAIQQFNGYYSNYMKLRDIGYYLDFDVVWAPDEPNVMRLYTNRHYLDPWTEPGPAAEAKTAVYSNMDIYVDDVKVQTDVNPVMIENNNYFKIRDIAKIMNFWCEFKPVTHSWGTVNNIYLDRNFVYVDEPGIAAGAQREWVAKNSTNNCYPAGQYASGLTYESSAWYTGKIGQTEDSPVTYTARDAWGNYDYTKLYFGKTDETMNAMAQLLLDRNVIEQNHDGVEQFEDGNRMNRYYRYPMVEYKENSVDNYLMPVVFQYDYAGSNFAPNFVVRSLDTNGDFGVLSIEYNANHRINKAKAATQRSAASILAEMETYNCDAEKILFLGSVVCKKMVYADGGVSAVNRSSKGIPAGVELTDFPTWSTQEEIASIWSDNKIYVGVCADYTAAFENLCNAAGYYYVSNTDVTNHIYDSVWVPDEGRWLCIDCSSEFSTAWFPLVGPGDWKGCSNNTALLDFFWMMEQIKPGGWLSDDYRLNP